MTSTLTFKNILWLLASLVLVAAPHVPRLPPWVALLSGLLVLWRLYIAQRGLHLPPRRLLLTITFAGLIGTYLSHGMLLGRDAGVTLLILLASLKLMEMRTLREALLVIFLGYFVVLTNFLYSQTIPTALYMLVVLLVITATLIGFNHVTGQPTIRKRLRLAGILLAQSVPMMLVLFVFFPRVQGPLWGLPQDAYAGVTGLSDTMTPGSISQLSLSDAVAFRVSFDTPIPKTTQMYWRGPVLWYFDGRSWSPGRAPYYRPPDYEATGEPVRYTVTIEPHNKRWLFALDLPATLPPEGAVSSDYQVLARAPVRTRIRYAASSYLNYRTSLREFRTELQRALLLPPGINPRARTLAQSWRQNAEGDAAVVRQALAYFRTEPFFYTLRPPLLGDQPVDDFLFNTRRGFCEHYASSFAFLMRAAGVPARVVTGYQGGELNPVGNYVIVRQADAHAWAEVWLGNQGWVRVDPTAAVSPLRIESGIAAAVPSSDPLPGMVRSDSQWLKNIRLSLDAAANSWNQWVLGYGPQRQIEFLSRAGMSVPDWKNMAVALFAGTGILLLGFAGWMFWRLRPALRDPVQAAYVRFCGKLARQGTPRRPSEGPKDYAARLGRLRPELAEGVKRISGLYIELRYGALQDEKAARELIRLVAEFKA